MRPVLARSLAAAACVLVAAGEGAAQGQASLASARREQRADSARVLRGARQAQARFEALRFRHLPWTDDAGGGAGRCDEYIGRFCIWHDEPGGPQWRPPPEPAPVRDGRARLIQALDEAAAASPGDAWVAGQRVRYLVEAGRAAEAVAAARECRAARWWCLALQGYALHFVRDHLAAEAAFAAAVAAMPPGERREWSDLTLLLRDGDARSLRRLAGAARDSLERRLWWLADPFWMRPGNDRKTEHFARLVADRFQDRARSTEGLSWADDLREILLRYGQPSGWERIRPRGFETVRRGLITHYADPSYEFFPPLRHAREPRRIEPGSWKLEERFVRTAFAPDSVRSFDELPHQLARFRRGDRVEVVAAFALEHDSLPAAPVFDAGLVLARDEAAEPLVALARVDGARGAIRLSARPETVLVSLEAVERTSRRAGRTRYAVDLGPHRAPGPALSDVLLLADPAARPASLDEAVPLARGSTRFRPGERLGLFWEVYGLDPRTDTLTLSVALSRRGVGGIRRAAERLGLARAATPVRMRWAEEIAASAILPRSLAVALPDLPNGDYVIEVSVRTREGATASATREIRVER